MKRGKLGHKMGTKFYRSSEVLSGSWPTEATEGIREMCCFIRVSKSIFHRASCNSNGQCGLIVYHINNKTVNEHGDQRELNVFNRASNRLAKYTASGI